MTASPQFSVIQILVVEKCIDDWRAYLVFQDREWPDMAYEIRGSGNTPEKALAMAYGLFLDDPREHATDHWEWTEANADKMRNIFR
jgi:hypothetical protein